MTLSWPKQPIEEINLIGYPILYITVTTPKNQSQLHLFLGLAGYIPVLVSVENDCQLWRFHHPDGPKPEGL